jgi:hypothetical protein
LNQQQIKQKMKWVSKYISRPLLIIVLLCVILYYFFPGVLESAGIDVKHLGKYAFWFFLIKGIVWLIVLGYGIIFLYNNKKNKT